MSFSIWQLENYGQPKNMWQLFQLDTGGENAGSLIKSLCILVFQGPGVSHHAKSFHVCGFTTSILQSKRFPSTTGAGLATRNVPEPHGL